MLRSEDGKTILHEDGTLDMKGANFREAISPYTDNASNIVSGTMYADKAEGIRFRLVDNPIRWIHSTGWLFSYKDAEISIEVSVAEKDKDKLEEIQGKIIEALKSAE